MMNQRTVQQIFLFAILVLATLAFLGVISDFIMPLFWAVVLAIVFRPVQKRWQHALGDRPSLASVLTLLTIVLVVVIPLLLIGAAVVNESVNIYARIDAGEVDVHAPLDYLERMLPTVTTYLDQYGIDLGRLRASLSSTAMTASQFLAQRAFTFGQNAVQFTVLLFLMLYVLYFFLRNGEDYVAALVRAIPLGDTRERWLLSRFAGVSRATIKGTLVVAVIQGGLGGLAFWALGITAPVLSGVLMTVFALLPAFGAAIIWFPVALVLLLTGEIIRGVVLVAFGAVVISMVDNVLRPALVGRDTQMPDFLILISTLGGLTAFGLSGFVIGPVIAAFFLATWEMFAEEYAEEKNLEVIKESLEDPEVPPSEANSPSQRVSQQAFSVEEFAPQQQATEPTPEETAAQERGTQERGTQERRTAEP